MRAPAPNARAWSSCRRRRYSAFKTLGGARSSTKWRKRPSIAREWLRHEFANARTAAGVIGRGSFATQEGRSYRLTARHAVGFSAMRNRPGARAAAWKAARLLGHGGQPWQTLCGCRRWVHRADLPRLLHIQAKILREEPGFYHGVRVLERELANLFTASNRGIPRHGAIGRGRGPV